MATKPVARDPRDTVTPDAFTVASEVLGLPLAKPLERMTAILVDLGAIGILSLSGSLSFALALGLLTFELVRGRRNGEPRRSKSLALLLALLIGSGIFWLGQQIDEGDSETGREESIAEVAETVEGLRENPELLALEKAVEALEKENQALRDAQDEASLVAWGEGLLDEFGFGFGWAAVYFTLLGAWWEGQTIGKRLLGLRVLRLNGKPLTMWNSFDRYGGYAAGLATGLLGFAQIFWDPNRQAIHDKICGTVVIEARKAALTPLPP